MMEVTRGQVVWANVLGLISRYHFCSYNLYLYKTKTTHVYENFLTIISFKTNNSWWFLQNLKVWFCKQILKKQNDLIINSFIFYIISVLTMNSLGLTWRFTMHILFNFFLLFIRDIFYGYGYILLLKYKLT